jgi:chromate transporter
VTLAGWAALLGQVMLLSLLSVGGAITVAPELHRLVVVRLGLVSDLQFTSSIALAQAAPGPNALYVAVLGYQAAGLAGALAALVGMLLPSTALALAAARWGEARGDWRGLVAFRTGLAPISLAMLGATCWILTAQATSWRPVAVTVMGALLVWRTRIHLLWLIAAGGLLGGLGWL